MYKWKVTTTMYGDEGRGSVKKGEEVCARKFPVQNSEIEFLPSFYEGISPPPM